MKNRLNGLTISILSFCIFSGLANIANAEDPVEMQRYLRKSTSFKFETLRKEIPVKIYYITGGTHSRPWDIGSPVIVYVKNHGYERIGREPDLSILMDYLKQRYIVITIDFANDPKAVSPHFDKDLHELFKAIYANDETSLLGTRLEPRKYRCFFLPAGCRVATDLVFWEVDKHGSHGTMKRVVRAYNEQVVDEKGRHHVAGRSLASSPGDLIDRDGAPLDCKLRMDIIYPSQADKKVPLIFWISTTTIRAPSSYPRGYRPHMTGFPMRGYAYAIIDHCYNPVALHYGHFKNGYSLDNINGLKAYTAAIRFIRAHADAYNVDPRYIGGWGHSKGAYAITRLSDPKHAERSAEHQRLKGEPEGSPEPQPWPGYSSRIAAGYQSMGNGTRRSAQYVTEDYAPTIVACGELDHFNHWLDWPRVVDAYEHANANHVALGMLGLGHELPYGRDDELGVDRYELVMSFFDRYLKAEEKLAPAVLSTTPRDKAEDVAPSEPITIQFAPVMDEASIVDGRSVKIIRSRDGSPVKGFWTSSRQSARFTFTPKEDFRAGEKYKVIVTTHVKNEAGTPLDEARIAEFTVGKMAVETKTSAVRLSSGGNGDVPSKGWVAPSPIVDALEARDIARNRDTNYREDKVPEYTLPDLLVMCSGTQVSDARTWQTKRRPEILELFRKHVYGRAPVDRPKETTFEVVNVSPKALDGRATLKRVLISIAGRRGQLSTTMSIFLPNSARRPVPIFLLLSHRDPSSTDWTRKIKRPFWPVEQIIARGYGTAAIQVTDFAPDSRDGWKYGVHKVFDGPDKRSADMWGTLAAWAWTGSRAMDYFETDDDIDHARVAVVGQSRGGKTALWAGARDERFAMAVSNCSGCGGAALSRRRYGETVKRINSSFPHWFCDNFKKYNDAEGNLPVDQHMLIALMAPRLVYVASAEEDLWADPKGEFLSAKRASEVYHLLELKGLEVENIPPIESPIHEGRIGHHIHAGRHDLIEYDWHRYLDFADKHWR